MSGSFAPRPDDHLVEPFYAGLSVGGRRFGFKGEGEEGAADESGTSGAPAGATSEALAAPEAAQPMGAALPQVAPVPLPPVRNSPVSVIAATLFLLGVIVVGMATMFLFGY